MRLHESKFERRYFTSTTTKITPCPTAGSSSQTTTVNYRSKTRNGVQNPYWRSQVSNGISATTAFDASETDVKAEIGFLESSRISTSCLPYAKNPVYTVQQSGQLLIDTTVVGTGTSANDQAAENIALTEFYKHARAAQTQFAGGTFLGELRETLHMIKHPAQSLRSLLNNNLRGYAALRRGLRHASPRRKLEILQDTWLEYSFGWSPLIGDTEDAIKAYDRLLNDIRPAIVVSGWGEDETSSITYANQFFCLNSVKVVKQIQTKQKAYVRYKGAVSQEASGPSLSNVLQGFGFNAQDFAPTVWELIPYSFLVDYFTNIGDIISAASFAHSNLRWVNRTYRRSVSKKLTGSLDIAGSLALISTGENQARVTVFPGSFEATYKYISRSSQQPGVPSISFTIPGLSTKWINLAALAKAHKLLTPF